MSLTTLESNGHGHPHEGGVSIFLSSAPSYRCSVVAPSIEIAARAADHFQRLYYSTYDSPTRADDIPNFYRPNSATTWNGTPYEGAQGMRELVSNMPKTKHVVQSFDCHPIPGTSSLDPSQRARGFSETENLWTVQAASRLRSS